MYVVALSNGQSFVSNYLLDSYAQCCIIYSAVTLVSSSSTNLTLPHAKKKSNVVNKQRVSEGINGSRENASTTHNKNH